MSERSIAEVAETRAAGYEPPLCPVCGAGNLAGRWEGPLGRYDRTTGTRGRLLTVDRGEWRWLCDNCGETGVWLPSPSRKDDPFIDGHALYDPEVGLVTGVSRLQERAQAGGGS